MSWLAAAAAARRMLFGAVGALCSGAVLASAGPAVTTPASAPAVAAAPALAASTSVAAPRTYTVAVGESLAAALQQAADGDVVQLQAGHHHGQVAVITHKRLTLRGVGGVAVLHADGQNAEGKAALVVRNGDVLVQHIEFRGNRVPDGNGAGIRFERGRLRVSQCSFFDNQNGILTSNHPSAELVVENSSFGQAPVGAKLPHLIYVGNIAHFTLLGSHLSGGQEGHLVKSRARINHVRYNYLVDGDAGRAAYELEFPHGGVAHVVGNVIGQSAGTSNPGVVVFGAEGPGPVQMPGQAPREHALVIVNNTLINTGLRPAWFVRVHEARLQQSVPQQLVNNLLVGLGVADVGWGDLGQGNVLVPALLLAPGDLTPKMNGTASVQTQPKPYSLPADSWLRGLGVTPPEGLQPLAEFVHPVGQRALAPRKRWSPGAFQE
jgi:hypothetical protein